MAARASVASAASASSGAVGRQSVSSSSGWANRLARASTLTRKPNESTLEYLARVTHLSLVHSDLTTCPDLGMCPALDALYLFDNRISSLTALVTLPLLTQLHLQNNQLTTLEGLEHCPALSHLDVSQNRLRHIGHLERCTQLTTLLVDAQQTDGEPLAWDAASMAAVAPTLRHVSCRRNALDDYTPLAYLGALTTLVLTHATLSRSAAACWLELTTCWPQLEHVDLTGIPALTGLRMRQSLILACPRLAVVSGKPVAPHERTAIEKLRAPKVAKVPSADAVDRHGRAGSAVSLSGIAASAAEQTDAAAPALLPHFPPFVSQYRDFLIQQNQRADRP
ncbi:hypothetical protein CXG81DRAFT_17616 [Caulochytrium protostelioides]|uniref:L domain-like protein n=1 Tax=Caulochytrium protostelioides TaxID=1555241 RepID=A0A4V1IV40_9FUNG|nr:hypothetical protein CXG81DRAFT_17616 [Caulochytrium protostelioides]|eukprot:RKP02729.1 hypothetical protein CXG81DRAFT_17616 [Caulochytrium protostelioides]